MHYSCTHMAAVGVKGFISHLPESKVLYFYVCIRHFVSDNVLVYAIIICE